MAENLATLRDYFVTTLQVPVEAREALIRQGLSSFDDLIGLTDKDVKGICSNAKEPGGTIQNPNWVAGGNMPQMIPNQAHLLGSFTRNASDNFGSTETTCPLFSVFCYQPKPHWLGWAKPGHSTKGSKKKMLLRI
jgi:hypothetical protein